MTPLYAVRYGLVVLTAALAALTAVSPSASNVSNASTDVEKTGVWPTATPESQGLDSSVLAELLEHVRNRPLPLHSMLIVRHGRLVFDATLFPFEPGRLHDLASATKSVTSVLIGIAIDEGHLTSVKQRVSELLPDAASAASAASASSAAADPRRDRVTVEHLLTMTSGWNCGVEPGEKELAAMRRSADWAAFALALPMWAEPGSKYAYCSCNNHVLSSIITARIHESARTFAHWYLFGPLGIKDVIWPADAKGRTHGWGDLQLKPHDLAKIGYLYLHGGRWNGKQIVSEEWVRQSITPHVTVRDGVGYGYGWWINTARQPAIYEMVGRGGQRVAVIPDKDLVVVFNGGGLDTDELAPFLLRAIKSDAPLPQNSATTNRLRTLLAEARQPPALASNRTPQPLPELARKISGSVYGVGASNPMNLGHLGLTFSGPKVAHANIRFFGGQWIVPVGLDGRPRLSSSGPSGHPMAAKGEWLSPNEFVLDLDTIANINHFVFHVIFENGRARLRIDEKTGELKNLTLPLSLLNPKSH